MPTATFCDNFKRNRFFKFPPEKERCFKFDQGQDRFQNFGPFEMEVFCIWFMDVCGEIWKSRQSDTWDMQAGFVWEIYINLS